jgi:hypothetical protein
VAVSLLALLPGSSHADGAWLDGPLVQWNSPGMAIPAAPVMNAPDFPGFPPCGRDERPVETFEDEAVAAAGWRLFRTYEAGWGVTVIHALTGYDGMCRPMGYQVFVFANGHFAGTISPEPMNSRTDGAGGTVLLLAPGDALSAAFQRYAESDPLCCPSRRSLVGYSIELDRTATRPVLLVAQVSTIPNEP